MSDKKKKKREGFWGAYINKKDGAIRGYDIKNPSVKNFLYLYYVDLRHAGCDQCVPNFMGIFGKL